MHSWSPQSVTIRPCQDENLMTSPVVYGAIFGETGETRTHYSLLSQSSRWTASRSVSMWWWPRRGLNSRRKDFQSFALPAELPGHIMVAARGVKPALESLMRRSPSSDDTALLASRERFELSTLSSVAICSDPVELTGHYGRDRWTRTTACESQSLMPYQLGYISILVDHLRFELRTLPL